MEDKGKTIEYFGASYIWAPAHNEKLIIYSKTGGRLYRMYPISTKNNEWDRFISKYQLFDWSKWHAISGGMSSLYERVKVAENRGFACFLSSIDHKQFAAMVWALKEGEYQFI